MSKDPSPARRLALILAVSLLARITLAVLGGQYFLGDEPRYHRGISLWLAASSGRWAEARDILGQPEHAAFTWLGAALTPFQHVLARFTGHGDWADPGNIYASSAIAAALLSIFSVVNILLLYRLAKAAGASEDEAQFAALLAAASNTLFYFSRHLLPYDAALSAWLGSLLCATSRDRGRRLASGIFAGLTYHLYNGYWFLLPLAAWWSTRAAAPENRRRWFDPAWLTGGALGIGLPVVIGLACGGTRYWATLRAFSDTVRQGLFAEGWSLPWEYLAHAESWLGLGVAAVVLAALIRFRAALPGHVRAWLLLAGAAYGLMVLVSTVLHRFVIYGRTARPLVPLICLLGGWAFTRLLVRPGHRRLAVAAIVAGGILNFLPQFTLEFPHDLEGRILANVGKTKTVLSVNGCLFRPLTMAVTRPDLALANAQMLYPVRDYAGYPRGEVLISLPHPLSSLPYQYEGHTPRERRILRENDIAMKLIRLADPASVSPWPPVERQFTAADRPDGFDHGAR